MTGVPATAAPVDPALLERRVRQVCDLMSVHAGAIELLGVSAGGVVRVRFTGMCQGCPFRPLTMHGTIIPALIAVPGVTKVLADGARISDEAAARLARMVVDLPTPLGPVEPRPA